MQPTAPRPLAALHVLVRHEVEFVVVGMMAGVLNGALVTTVDLDIVHRRTPENIVRVMAALGELGASYRDLTGRRLPPNPSLLAATPGHNLFSTNCGSVDVLSTVGKRHSYEDLLPNSIEVDLEGSVVRTIGLALLIELKENAARPKDLAVLPLLRNTLAEMLRRRG